MQNLTRIILIPVTALPPATPDVRLFLPEKLQKYRYDYGGYVSNWFVEEKVHQAIELLKEKNIDMWITIVRETAAHKDPVLPLLLNDSDLTWLCCFILTKTGKRIAIVGHFDAEIVRREKIFTSVIPYHESIKPHLLNVLNLHDPQTIAINYSTTGVLADGLSHGLFLVLNEYLADTPYKSRLMSSAEIINPLRERKSPTEIEALQTAVRTTLKIFQSTFEFVQVGMTENHIADYMKKQIEHFNVKPAWNKESCPIINTGPHSPIGHCGPTARTVEYGHIVHFDFGIEQNGYCSDIQRVLYLMPEKETRIPEPVQKAFTVVQQAIQAAFRSLKPGVRGKEVDAIARSFIINEGYPEYMHATGHHIGRFAHDGSGILGPAWERYGNAPFQFVEENHTYTLELGVIVEGYGYIGLEEDVVVTRAGAQFLSTPQTELIVK